MPSASSLPPLPVVTLLALLAGAPVLTLSAAAQPAPGALPCLTQGVPAGYGTFLSLRSVRFQQATNRAPDEVEATHILEFKPPTAYAATNVGVSGPGGFKAALARQADGSSTWSVAGMASALATQIPSGNYNASFLLAFPNGDSFVGFFPYALASNTPPIPQLANFEAAQNIAATERFALQWTPWIGAGAQDRIELQLRDDSGRLILSASSDCTATNALAVGASQFEIPAGFLSAGKSYFAHLTFGGAQLVASDDSSLVAQRGFHARTTSFPLRTRVAGGTTGEPATLSRPTITGTNLVFQVAGTPGARYAIESSGNLVDWTKESEITVPTTGSVAVTLPLPSDGVPRFYRASPIAGGGGGSVTPGPATLALSLAGNRLLSLAITGTPGATYAVESSATYAAWTGITNVTLPAVTTPTATLTVALPVPEGTDFLAYRARGIESSVTPPKAEPGNLTITRSETQVTLALSGASPGRTYTVQQHTADWAAGTWQTTEITITTDASGSGSKSVPISVTGGTSIFYRTLAP